MNISLKTVTCPKYCIWIWAKEKKSTYMYYKLGKRRS